MNEPPAPILSCSGLVKTFDHHGALIHVLRGVDLLLGEEQSIAIVGASGSGKSTLLHLLAGLDQPTAGHISINGADLGSLDERGRGALRNRTLGFVYQFHHLLPEFTAEENVAMPLLIRRDRHREALGRARRILRRVGLEPTNCDCPRGCRRAQVPLGRRAHRKSRPRNRRGCPISLV